MKILVGILACHKRLAHISAQRSTWLKDCQVDYKFFFGRGSREPLADEIVLDVDDGYPSLPTKVRLMCRWALDNGYEYLFKCDDDTYVRPERLISSGFEQHDYIGRVNWNPRRIGYCSGGPGYWLSAKAMRIISASDKMSIGAEDHRCADALYLHGIEPIDDPRYTITMVTTYGRTGLDPRCVYPAGVNGPKKSNNLITVCEFPPRYMGLPHQEWLESCAS
jgi:hypothetical protein